MTKSFTAKSSSVSGGGKHGLAVGGTITDGLASAIDRYIRMEVSDWVIVSLFSMALQHRRDEIVRQIRAEHGARRPWERQGQSHHEMMLAIADVIEGAP